MGLFGDLFGKKDEPTLTSKEIDTRTQDEKDRDLLISSLYQQEQLLGVSIGAFNNEKERQNKLEPPKNQEQFINRNSQLGELRSPITKYTNNIRDLLRNAGVSPDKYSDIYSMYVEGRDVASENYTSERLQALDDEIKQKTTRGNLPDFDELNRRRMGLESDGTLQSGQTPASQGIDALQKSGNLSPEDIEKIASNLEGSGASQSEIDKAQNLRDSITNPTPQRTPGGYLGDEITPEQPMDFIGAGYAEPSTEQSTESNKPDTSNIEPITESNTDLGGGVLGGDVIDETGTAGVIPSDEPNLRGSGLQGGRVGQRNDDLETTQKHHEATETTTIQDETLDFQHLGGSRTNFDNNFVGFVLEQFLKKSLNVLTSKVTGIDTKWTNLVIEPAVSKAPELYNLLRNGMGNEYGRLDIHDNHQSLTRPTLPLIIIILYLYVVDRGNDFKIDFNFIEGYFIKKVLKDYFNFNNELVDYGMDIISKIPNELATAYKKQKGNMENIITANEVNEISKLVQYINIEYSKRFNKNLANELFNFENKQSLYLYEMLETLPSSSTLFQISSAFNTINNLISEMVTNPYLLVQLIALIYDENENKNLASSDVLSRGKVDKYIYYYSDLEGGVKEDLKVSVLKNIHLDMDKRGKVKGMSLIENSDKVALYNYKGRYYVTFRGTDTKDAKDIRSNILNFGGKDLLNNPEYDERIKIGKKYLDLAIMKSRQENLEPPIILGFSLGGVSAMYLSTIYKNIETDVYSPILSKSEMTENIMDYLGNSNIHFNYGEKDPISSNMEYYRKKFPDLDINKYKNNKFYSPHSLEQFI